MSRFLKYAWATMFVVCAALGALEGASGIAKAALMLLAVLFFLPPALLLYNGIMAADQKTVKTIRVISLVSLLLTTILLVLYFVLTLLYAATAVSAGVVNVTYYVLLLVSAPLFCGQYFFLSLFLWACLLFATFLQKKQP